MNTDRLAGRRLLVGTVVLAAVGAIAWRLFTKAQGRDPECGGASPLPGGACPEVPALAGGASPESATQMWAGTLSRPEMTAYQYGTHLLSGRPIDGRPEQTPQPVAFALRSSRVPLDDWLGKTVIVTGGLVAGYPLDFGPPLIEVHAIEADQVITIDSRSSPVPKR